MGKQQAVAAVDVQFTTPQQWFVGAQTYPQPTFYIEVKVTTGTNTRDEKAAFIQRAYDGMQTILGPTNPTSYIVLQNVSPDDWGFGGRTQGYRYLN